MEKLYFVFILCLLGAISANGLECYICSNCPLPTIDETGTCQAKTSSTISSETDSTTTTTAITINAQLSINLGSSQQSITDRQKRSLEENTSSNGCTCYNGICDCSIKFLAVRANGRTEDPSENEPETSTNAGTTVPKITVKESKFQSYKHIHLVNNQTVVDRGCAEVIDEISDAPCDYTTYGCYWCEKSKCNSAINRQLTISLIIITMFIIQVFLPMNVML